MYRTNSPPPPEPPPYICPGCGTSHSSRDGMLQAGGCGVCFNAKVISRTLLKEHRAEFAQRLSKSLKLTALCVALIVGFEGFEMFCLLEGAKSCRTHHHVNLTKAER